MDLYKTGQVDAMTAMKMIADLSASKPSSDTVAPNPPNPEEKPPTKKRDRSPEPEPNGLEITDDDVNEIGGHLDSRLTLDLFPSSSPLKW